MMKVGPSGRNGDRVASRAVTVQEPDRGTASVLRLPIVARIARDLTRRNHPVLTNVTVCKILVCFNMSGNILSPGSKIIVFTKLE